MAAINLTVLNVANFIFNTLKFNPLVLTMMLKTLFSQHNWAKCIRGLSSVKHAP